jgi:ADP-ribosylglycohydrolase
MFGAVCGDVLGAPYEVNPVTFRDFILLADNSRVTDDTVCTCAVAEAILDGTLDFAGHLRRHAKAVGVAYGPRFEQWVHSDVEWNDSAGNGAVSRVGAIPWLAPDLATAIGWAARSAMTSHRHPDAVAAAIAVSAAARLGLDGWPKDEAVALAAEIAGYNMSRSLDEIRPGYGFRLLASATAPVSLRAVLEAVDFKDAMRLAISMGGDADTLAAAAGGIAEVFHPVPRDIRDHVVSKAPRGVMHTVSRVEAAKVPASGSRRGDERLAMSAASEWIERSRSPKQSFMPSRTGWVARTAGRLRGLGRTVTGRAGT